MSVVRANGVEIHYAVSGHGPWVTLSHALGADLSLWDAQVDALSREFTVLRYDTRGHGGSSAPAGSYAFSDLVQEARERVRREMNDAHSVEVRLQRMLRRLGADQRAQR